MHKIVVVYKSKYGTTKRYAQWIAEELACAIFEQSKINPNDLSQYDTILYGGGLYAGSVAGLKKFLPRLGSALNKKLVLFMVGTTNPAETKVYAEIAKRNLPAKWEDRFEVFALRGDQLFSKMSGLHRLLMRMPKSIAEKKPVAERTEDDNHFLENFGSDVIFTTREQIEPILRYLQQ